MGRALGGWLEGPGTRRDDIPGVRLGLPAHGPGSAAGFGPRLGAFAVDGLLANMLAGVPYLIGFRYDTDARGMVVYLAFLLQAFLLVSLTGQTVGMRLCGIRVIRVRDGGRQSWPWIAGRTLLLGLLVSACIWDRDQRGQHDRAAGTIIVRDRRRPTTATPTTATPSTGNTRTDRLDARRSGSRSRGGRAS